MRGTTDEPAVSIKYTLWDVYGGGKWWMLPKDFFLIVGDSEAILLSYLVNKSDLHTSSGGWFFCRTKELQDTLNWSKNKQTRLYGSLEADGYLLTRYQGMPRKREIKLKDELIMECINKAKKKHKK